MWRTRWFFAIGLTIGMLAALVIPAGASPPDWIRCGTDDPFNPEFIEYTTISGDLLVDGYCALGPGAVISGNVFGRRGSGLGIGQQALVDGNVTLRGGGLYMGGPSDVLPDPPATVTGTIEVVNAETGIFDVPGATIIYGEVGGDVIIKNAPSVQLSGGCANCGPGPLGPLSIGGNVTITNVRGDPPLFGLLQLSLNNFAIAGSVSLTNVDGQGQIALNMIGGDLSCKNVRELNTWTVEGNTAGGTDTCQPA